MRYLSVCSGIEAASVAFEPLGWEAIAFAEIDPFACAVLAHRFPHVRNLGDFTKIEASDVGTVDLLIGGTPCQSFSCAGKRLGLDDPRGNLAIEFLRLAQRIRPRWILFENVVGLLQSDGGRNFGIFLGLLGECGFQSFAYRVLDARHFGVGQRRRRVFVVGYSGAERNYPQAVLFNSESLRRHCETRRETREIASALTATGVGGGSGPDDNSAQARHLVAVSSVTLACTPNSQALMGFAPRMETSNVATVCSEGDGARDALEAAGDALMGKPPAGSRWTGVRRLVPVEAERLMNFPDDFTLVPYRGKPASDAVRFRALGNSMVTNVIYWIGSRIQMVEDIINAEKSKSA